MRALHAQVLLLAHRALLLPDWHVRLAGPDDMVGVHSLIGSLPEGKELQDTVLQALGTCLGGRMGCGRGQRQQGRVGEGGGGALSHFY